ncbi:MAG: hypothetical protein JWP95_1401 [Actinotalea sp.]|nr:hypothetical protein [Actinotalea sp.]
MSQTLMAPAVTPAPTTEPSVVVMQGKDPATGHLATWHFIPLAAPDPDDDAERAGSLCRVERVSGSITHPAVWMQASKEITVVTAAEALELQGRILSA